MNEEGGRPLRRRDVMRLGLVAFFATCTGIWAGPSFLAITGWVFAAYYGVGFTLGVGIKILAALQRRL